MQETRPPDFDETGENLKELFLAENEMQLTKLMDDRLDELKQQGHTFVKRVKVGRNDKCPCGSGKKFKKCCLSAVNQVGAYTKIPRTKITVE